MVNSDQRELDFYRLYDGQNRRGIKSSSEGRTLYFYDPSGRLLTEMTLSETEGSGVGKDYIYLDGGPLARVDWLIQDNWGECPPGLGTGECDPVAATADLFYYHADHLGTPIAMTDGSATIVWNEELRPFGEVQPSQTSPPIENNLRFPGQYFDQETGLHQNWFRDYDPKTGRYREADPIGLFGGPNPYGYVDANPVDRTDPTGLYTEVILWHPAGWTDSSFGHVSSNVNGRSFSWSPSGWDRTYPSAADYAARNQEFRSGNGFILALTPEQEAKLVSCYERSSGPYDKATNNCTQPQIDCLREATGGAIFGNNWTGPTSIPIGVALELARSPYFVGGKSYPTSRRRGYWELAPWAKW